MVARYNRLIECEKLNVGDIAHIRVAKRAAKQIDCDGGPVPAWPSLGYLYSYRCIGKVGSLLASATAGPLFRSLHEPTIAPVASQHNGHKYEKLVQSAAHGRFIAYELSDLSIAYRSPPPSSRVVSLVDFSPVFNTANACSKEQTP